MNKMDDFCRFLLINFIAVYKYSKELTIHFPDVWVISIILQNKVIFWPSKSVYVQTKPQNKGTSGLFYDSTLFTTVAYIINTPTGPWNNIIWQCFINKMSIRSPDYEWRKKQAILVISST